MSAKTQGWNGDQALAEQYKMMLALVCKGDASANIRSAEDGMVSRVASTSTSQHGAERHQLAEPSLESEVQLSRSKVQNDTMEQYRSRAHNQDRSTAERRNADSVYKQS